MTREWIIYILLKKSFAPITLYSLYLKLWESVTLPKVKKNVWNITEIFYGYVETIHKFLNSLNNNFGNSQNSHLNLQNVIWILIKIVIKHAPIYISSCNNSGIKSMGVIPLFCKSQNFWNFTDFCYNISRKKVVTFFSFLAIFMKSYTVIVKTWSKQIIIVILHFWVKNVVFEQK